MLVRWTQPAADDLTQICDYALEHFGPTHARNTALAFTPARNL
jgi:plasmid stabilization system protein ParE